MVRSACLVAMVVLAGCSSPGGMAPPDLASPEVLDLAELPVDTDADVPDNIPDGLDPGTRLEVSGKVLDFENDQPLGGAITLAVSGVSPAPAVTVTAPDFTIAGVPPTSALFVKATTANYRDTIGFIGVQTTRVTGAELRALRVNYANSLENTFNVNPKAGTGVVVAQVVDPVGVPKAGVPVNAFLVNGAAAPKTPFFLDAQKKAQQSLSATSASGYVVLFDVPAGTASVSGANGAKLDGPSVPVEAGTVTLLKLVYSAGAAVPPSNVSFSKQVVPIFQQRLCVVCHSTNGIGRQLGGLTLSNNTAYREVTQELSPNFNTVRVNLADPPKSLILTMPSYETPPDSHPNAIFTGPADPDYQTILVWIKEGAKNN